MFSKPMRDIAKPQWLGVIRLLKRSTGMSVSEMSKALKMSYMGVKQHCVDLEKRGYVDTWRRPKPVGRPEKVYRLTSKADELFPGVPESLVLSLLELVNVNYGPSAAEKLLYAHFQKRAEEYLEKVKGGSMVERGASLTKLRASEGYLSEFDFQTASLMRIVDYHNPLATLENRYPTMVRMEELLIERIVGGKAKRMVEHNSGLHRYTFTISA